MAEFDDVAVQVCRADKGEGAVRFEGWLGPLTEEVVKAAAAAADATASATADPSEDKEAAAQKARTDANTAKNKDGRFRFFINAWFTHWLEIPSDAILHQLDRRTDHPYGCSVIWVKREARITRCQSGFAHEFGELDAAMGDDPTDVRRRPYP